MSIERVVFTVDGDRVVGDLHEPANPGARCAVVVAGPMTSVKEQVTGVYAAALARHGISALAIDHRGFGESGGRPRQYERWDRKVADLKAAVDLLASREDATPGAIGAAAVCLGAGYAAHLAAADARVRAVGFVAGYYRDPKAMHAADPGGFDAKVAQGRAARERWEATGELETIPAAAANGDAAMQTADTVDYYTRRAVHPNYANAFAVMSREYFLPFDVQKAASKLNVPSLLIHSDQALNPKWARQFFDALACEKELIWIASRGQTDFYDNPLLVEPIAGQMAAHFHRHLESAPPTA